MKEKIFLGIVLSLLLLSGCQKEKTEIDQEEYKMLLSFYDEAQNMESGFMHYAIVCENPNFYVNGLDALGTINTTDFKTVTFWLNYKMQRIDNIKVWNKSLEVFIVNNYTGDKNGNI